MTSFCNCSTCKMIKDKIRMRKHPLCSYCNEHHDPRIHCIEEVDSRKPFGGNNPFQFFGMSMNKKDNAKDISKDPDNSYSSNTKVKHLAKIGSNYFLDVDNGKYSVYQKRNGTFKALRHGEHWRDLTGDNLIFHLMVELIDAKKIIKDAIIGITEKSDSNYQTLEILKGEK